MRSTRGFRSVGGLVAGAVAMALALTAVSASGEVAGSGDGWFTTHNVITLQAPPSRVWKALVDDVGRWWSPDHTWSHDARNLSIEARPGGCFCEKLPHGGVRHLQVIFADKEKALRLTGALGPMQEQPVEGVLTWALEPAGSGTRLSTTYRLAGHSDAEGGLAALAPAVDRVMSEQMERLRLYIETGSPEAANRGAIRGSSPGEQ